MSYSIIVNYQKDEKLRNSFNSLAERTFGLNFEGWYKSGFWNDKYIPYSILLEGEVIANVSVNIIDCNVNGKERHYIQLGTVMTDVQHRNKGYSRILMEKILSDYKNCDGIFLFANDDVLYFYPKFGFQKADEYRFRAVVNTKNDACVEQIPMKNKDDFSDFIKIKSSHVSRSPIKTDTDDLMMFYLTQFMQECVYKVKDKDCYIIAEKDNDTLTVFDILSNESVNPIQVSSSFGDEVKYISFAFTPENSSSLEKYLYKKDDTTFFVLGDTLINDLPDILSFPALVHA